ncbi:MAG TPA: hypothetical protein PKW35_13680, partial [Nannocystaceae bacterium]|nr:hypothetical protein [Nannocystaceae bacterium]
MTWLLGQVRPEGADPAVAGLEVAGEAADLEAEGEAAARVGRVGELAAAELEELRGAALLLTELG